MSTNLSYLDKVCDAEDDFRLQVIRQFGGVLTADFDPHNIHPSYFDDATRSAYEIFVEACAVEKTFAEKLRELIDAPPRHETLISL